MTSTEFLNKPAVVAVWTATEKKGLMRPTDIARAVAQDLEQRRVSERYLAREIARYPTKDFVYPGSREAITTLAEQGNDVTLWTQGNRVAQAHKIASSGLTDLHQKGPRSRKRQLGYYCHEDKIPALPELVQQLDGTKPILIVDDKAENILRIHRVMQGNEQVIPIWINQGRVKDQVPEGFTPDTFKQVFTTISSLPELLEHPQLRELLQRGGAQVLLDVDHTILNTGAWKKAIEADIHAKLTQPAVIDPFADTALGFSDGSHHVSTRFQNGMSGRMIASVTAAGPGTEEAVIKLGRSEEECVKIEREARGYRLLQQSPLAPHLIAYDTTHASMGVLSSPRFPGTDIRTLLQQGHCDAGMVLPVLKRLATDSFSWWKQQERGEAGPDLISMQRREWQETKDLLLGILSQYAATAGLTEHDLLSRPWIAHEVALPPLSDLMERYDQFLADPPPYTLQDHNDLTGANILLAPDGQFKILDYEWAGPADPAESFVRMAKWRSATTISNTHDAHITLQGDTLALRGYQGSEHWSEDAAQINNFYHAQLERLQENLADPSFASRVGHYFIGSYLREIALSDKRGTVASLPIIIGLIADYAQYI